MRVCFLTERMLLGYGVDLVVHKLGEGLSKIGHEVTVCCNVRDKTFEKAPYRIKQIPYWRVPNHSKTEEHAYEVMRSTVSDQDVLVPCTFPYYYVAFKSGKPYIAIDFGVVPPKFFPGRIARELKYHWKTQYEKYYQKAATIVFISEFLKRRLPVQFENRTEIIYPGIDHYPDIYLCELKKLYGLTGTLLLYFGRSTDISPYKNTDAILKLYQSLKRDYPELSLVISTNCTPEEQRRLEKHGAIVVNSVLMHFVPSIYRSADIFVTATLWEGFDLPLLEASYFGLPVVANAIGAHPEIVRHERTGFLTKDENELPLYVSRLLDDSKLRKKMGENGKVFARKNFSWSDTISRFEKVLNGI